MTKSRGILLRPRRPWSDVELELLTRNYADSRTEDIATVLGRTLQCVYVKAAALGLKKSEAYLASPNACRLRRGGGVGMANRWRKGQTPWNKGTHYVAGGRSAETRFKPGRPPHEARNYLPIGSLRINADGYLERKVTDDPSIVPVRRWVGVHRLVWEAANGPIPEGHVVCFRPGRRTPAEEDITLDALELVARAELARRNHFRRLGPEMAKVIQLRGAITRQINKRTREAA